MSGVVVEATEYEVQAGKDHGGGPTPPWKEFGPCCIEHELQAMIDGVWPVE